MQKNKINLVYDATIVANGAKKDSNRSGIYVVAINILKELVKNTNLDITLYCDYNAINDLQTVLANDFAGKKFKIISDIPVLKIILIYKNLKKIKDDFKRKNKIFLKILLQVILLFYSLIVKITCYIYSLITYYKKYDVYFSPASSICKIFKNQPDIKKIYFLHDTIPLIFPEYFNTDIERGFWHNELMNSLNTKDFYITNSESTRNDFLKYSDNINPDRIKTVLLACDKKFQPADSERINNVKIKYNIGIDKKYIFSLCTLEPRKNLVRAVRTFIEFIKKNNISDLYFVLGGAHWTEFINILEKTITDIGNYKDKIIITGYVDDEDLAPLYSGSEWFVYTSQYEGFGLPPLEAMSCGCPVITSNNSSLPEVVGNAGIMIDWDSDEQHIEAYEKYYFSKELKEKNRQKSLERAKLFSWEKCGKEIIKIIRKNL